MRNLNQGIFQIFKIDDVRTGIITDLRSQIPMSYTWKYKDQITSCESINVREVIESQYWRILRGDIYL